MRVEELTSNWIDPQVEWMADEDLVFAVIPLSDEYPNEIRLIDALSRGRFLISSVRGLLVEYIMWDSTIQSIILEAFSADAGIRALMNWLLHHSRAEDSGLADSIFAATWGGVVSPDLVKLEEIFERVGGVEVASSPWDQEKLCEPLDLDIFIKGIYRQSNIGEIVLLLSRNGTLDQSFIESGISRKCQDLLAESESKKDDMAHCAETGSIAVPDGMWDLLPAVFLFESETLFEAQDYNSTVIQKIADTGHRKPRDGIYKARHGVKNGSSQYVMVSGEPHYDIRSSYPEVRACLQKYLPGALAERRMNSAGPPGLPFHTVTIFDQKVPYDPLFETTFDSDKRDELKKEIQQKGFEAMAWYAPYHQFNEETWGIYFDSEKLDQFAHVIFEGLRDLKYGYYNSKIDPMELAVHLAFGSVYAHEMFHAKVEAVISWLEITCSDARYLTFKKNVYDRLFLTKGCIEEALANWSSFEWVKTYALQNRLEDVEILLTCFKQNLDLSPPGYRDWRFGDKADYWRVFSTQIITGLPECSNLSMPLPVPSLLKEPFPFHFVTADIPVRFVGQGMMANAIQGQESNLPHISRKEFIKALKYFGFEPMPASRGKGSHEMWTAPDKGKFPVPSGKSISHTVTKSFFNHCSITKGDYIRIRADF